MLENQLIKPESRDKRQDSLDPTNRSVSEKCDYGEYTFASAKKRQKSNIKATSQNITPALARQCVFRGMVIVIFDMSY
jgi:hypothetical protein